LNEALHDLPEAEREAFLLHELAGLRYNEIAQVTQSTVDAVRSRLFRARMQLRERLTSSRTRLER
jgi:RNA polymerase sigma-70 factor (ECF subfamily)